MGEALRIQTPSFYILKINIRLLSHIPIIRYAVMSVTLYNTTCSVFHLFK